MEATEERKRKAKQLEMQRKESARRGISSAPRTPSYPTYTAPVQTTTETYDSYEAEKKKNRYVRGCQIYRYCRGDANCVV